MGRKDLGPHVGFDAILQLERRLPVVECRRGRAEHGGRERGLDRRAVRLGRSVGRLPVPGRLSGHPADAIGRRRPGLEGRSDPSVQVPPLARRQVLDDRLCEQPVPEAVAGLVGDQHLAVDRLPDRGQVVALSSPKDRREHRFVERATNDRSRPQGVRARVRQRPHLGEEHLRKQVRERPEPEPAAATSSSVNRRVAARSLVDASGELPSAVAPRIASTCIDVSSGDSGSSVSIVVRGLRPSSAIQPGASALAGGAPFGTSGSGGRARPGSC